MTSSPACTTRGTTPRWRRCLHRRATRRCQEVHGTAAQAARQSTATRQCSMAHKRHLATRQQCMRTYQCSSKVPAVSLAEPCTHRQASMLLAANAPPTSCQAAASQHLCWRSEHADYSNNSVSASNVAGSVSILVGGRLNLRSQSESRSQSEFVQEWLRRAHPAALGWCRSQQCAMAGCLVTHGLNDADVGRGCAS